MYSGVRLSMEVPPTAWIITLAEAKEWLRIDDENEDFLIEDLIRSATEHLEIRCGRALMPATYRLHLDCFPDHQILLPLPPCLSVQEITYVDEHGDQQTLDPSLYQTDVISEPARIVPAYGESWPYTREQLNAVVIAFVAGYPAAPTVAKQYVRLLVAHWYENREGVITGTITAELPVALQSLALQLNTGVQL